MSCRHLAWIILLFALASSASAALTPVTLTVKDNDGNPQPSGSILVRYSLFGGEYVTADSAGVIEKNWLQGDYYLLKRCTNEGGQVSYLQKFLHVGTTPIVDEMSCQSGSDYSKKISLIVTYGGAQFSGQLTASVKIGTRYLPAFGFSGTEITNLLLRMTPGEYTFKIRDPDSAYTVYLSQDAVISSEGQAVTIDFTPAASASGSLSLTLKNADGTPMASNDLYDKQDKQYYALANTDAYGYFSLPVAPGVYSFAVPCISSDEKYTPFIASFTIIENQVVDEVIQCKSPNTVTVTVTSGSQPVPGLFASAVFVSPEGGSASSSSKMTDEAGTALLSAQDGKYSIRIWQLQRMYEKNITLTGDALLSFEIPALTSSFMVSVKDSAGAPLAEIPVSFSNASRQTGLSEPPKEGGTTGFDGIVQKALFPGDYIILASCGSSIKTAKFDVPLGENDMDHPVDLVCGGSGLTFVFRDSAGTILPLLPVSTARASLDMEGYGSAIGFSDTVSLTYLSGNPMTASLTPGTYAAQLYFYATPQCYDQSFASIPLEPGKNTVLDLTFDSCSFGNSATLTSASGQTVLSAPDFSPSFAVLALGAVVLGVLGLRARQRRNTR